MGQKSDNVARKWKAARRRERATRHRNGTRRSLVAGCRLQELANERHPDVCSVCRGLRNGEGRAGEQRSQRKLKTLHVDPRGAPPMRTSHVHPTRAVRICAPENPQAEKFEDLVLNGGIPLLDNTNVLGSSLRFAIISLSLLITAINISIILVIMNMMISSIVIIIVVIISSSSSIIISIIIYIIISSSSRSSSSLVVIAIVIVIITIDRYHYE